jgi:hypothetical protein
MQIFKNKSDVHMMLWEVNPAKRNTNNVIGFIAPNAVVVSVGDTILADSVNSRYSINKIEKSKPSARKGYTYYTATTTYKN